ncbi:MAG: hypothetical protein AAF763_05865 [Pseudomonadota bacterium]
MSPQDMSPAETTSTETAIPVEAGPATVKQDPIGAVFGRFGGFDSMTESGLGRLALIGSKVLLFNVFFWGPIAALGYMLLFW